MINVTPPTNFVSLPQSLPLPASDQPFDLLLGTVSAPLPELALAPATPKPADIRAGDTLTAEAIESGETLLAFLGFNPVKTQQSETISKEVKPLTEDEDDLITSDIALPTPVASEPQYQPIAAATAVGNPAVVQTGLRTTSESAARDDRTVSTAILRSAPAVAPDINQSTGVLLTNGAQSPATAGVDPEPFAAAARAAAIAANTLPIVVTNDPVAVAAPAPAPAIRTNTQPEAAEIVVTAGLASLVQGRSPQTPAASTDIPEERVADVELLSTSPSTSVSPPLTSSLTNGPTTPIAVTQADPLQTIADRQLDLARDTRWIDELARDIVSASGRSDRLSFSLVPPQLGQLHVDLSHGDQGLSVHMRSDSEATTQIVGAAQPRLVEELKSQGIRVASTEVTTGGGQSQGQGQQQRDDSQLFEFARQRFETTDDTETDRPGGRFA